MKRLARWLTVLDRGAAWAVKWGFRTFALLGVIGVLSVVGMVLLVLSPWWETVGVGVSPAEANATIHQRFAIPASAWDVSFSTTPRDSMVTFRVEPADFNAWTRSRGLRATAVERGLPAYVFAIHSWGEVEYGVELLPDGGVRFDEPGGCFVSGTYVPSRRRCYARFSCK